MRGWLCGRAPGAAGTSCRAWRAFWRSWASRWARARDPGSSAAKADLATLVALTPELGCSFVAISQAKSCRACPIEQMLPVVRSILTRVGPKLEDFASACAKVSQTPANCAQIRQTPAKSGPNLGPSWSSSPNFVRTLSKSGPFFCPTSGVDVVQCCPTFGHFRAQLWERSTSPNFGQHLANCWPKSGAKFVQHRGRSVEIAEYWPTPGQSWVNIVDSNTAFWAQRLANRGTVSTQKPETHFFRRAAKCGKHMPEICPSLGLGQVGPVPIFRSEIDPNPPTFWRTGQILAISGRTCPFLANVSPKWANLVELGPKLSNFERCLSSFEPVWSTFGARRCPGSKALSLPVSIWIA